MIKYSKLEEVFLEYDLVIHDFNLETDEEIDLPYLVYDATAGETFVADGVNYYNYLTISLGIISETADFMLQRKIEEVLSDNYTTYDKQINFDGGARLYTITYNFVVEDDASD